MQGAGPAASKDGSSGRGGGDDSFKKRHNPPPQKAPELIHFLQIVSDSSLFVGSHESRTTGFLVHSPSLVIIIFPNSTTFPALAANLFQLYGGMGAPRLDSIDDCFVYQST